MKHIYLLSICTTTLLFAGGCSTTAGVGEDLQSAGKAITKSSEDARK